MRTKMRLRLFRTAKLRVCLSYWQLPILFGTLLFFHPFIIFKSCFVVCCASLCGLTVPVMPLDTRRNCYQKATYHPDRFKEAEDGIPVALVNENGLRTDNRSETDPRAIFMETGIVTRSKGSSYVEVGQTKIICACYGPRQMQSRDSDFSKGILVCDIKYASFAASVHKSDQSNLEEKEMSSLLADALSPCVRLDKFPKAEVDIYVTVLEDDGSVLASSITAASLALADAGIEMYTLAVGASMRQVGDNTLVDPTAMEISQRVEKGVANGHMTLSYMVDLSQISMISQQGYIGSQQLTQGVLTLIDMCKEIHPMMHRCLLTSVKRRL